MLHKTNKMVSPRFWKSETKAEKGLLSLFQRLAVMCRMTHDNVKRHNTSNNGKSTPDYQSHLMKSNSAIP